MIRPRNISFRRVRKLLLFTKFKIFTSPVLYRKRKKEKEKFNTEKDDAPLEFQSALLTSRISKRGKIKWRINKATRWTICPYPWPLGNRTDLQQIPIIRLFRAQESKDITPHLVSFQGSAYVNVISRTWQRRRYVNYEVREKKRKNLKHRATSCHVLILIYFHE